jgi:hypothetical protein
LACAGLIAAPSAGAEDTPAPLETYFPDPALRYQVCRLLAGCPAASTYPPEDQPAELAAVGAFEASPAQLAAIDDQLVWQTFYRDRAPNDYQGNQGFADRGIVDPTGVSYLTGLATLNLQNNLITELPDGVFAGLTDIGVINLNGNQLTAVTHAQLAGPTALQGIQLDDNQISDLEPGFLAGLNDGSTPLSVSLSHNQLTTLDPGTFQGVAWISTLGLSYNALEALPESLFSATKVAGYLMLVHNQLTTLPAGLLAGQADVGFVHFMNNQIASLPEGFLSSFSGGYLDFTSNPLAALPADACQVAHQLVFRDTAVYDAACAAGGPAEGLSILVDEQRPARDFYGQVDQEVDSWTVPAGFVLINGPTGQANQVATTEGNANPWFDGTTVTAPFTFAADGVLQATIDAAANPIWSVERDLPDWSNAAVGLVSLTIRLHQFPAVEANDLALVVGHSGASDVTWPDLLPGYSAVQSYELVDGAGFVQLNQQTGEVTATAAGVAQVKATLTTVEDPSLVSEAVYDVTVTPARQGGQRTVSGQLAIGGQPRTGETLTATLSAVTPATAEAGPIEWYAGDGSAPVGTGETYTVQAADAGQPVWAQVALDGGEAGSGLIVAPAVKAAEGRSALAAVTIQGVARPGRTLTAQTSAVSPAGAALAYQWYRGGAAIDGATQATYSPVAADTGHSLTVAVTVTQTGYATVTANSPPLRVGAGA